MKTLRVFYASGAIQRQRFWGTLELLVAAPVRFAFVLLPMMIAISSVGIYCLATTLVWGRLVYGIPLRIGWIRYLEGAARRGATLENA